MDIKLIKNYNGGKCIPIGSNLLLQSTDANYKFGNIIGKKIYIFNTENSEQYEIAPELKKYDITDLRYCRSSHDYIVFVSIQEADNVNVSIKLYRYTIPDNETVEIYSFQINKFLIYKVHNIKIFVADKDHLIIQTVEYNKPYKFNTVIVDVSNNSSIIVENEDICNYGIYSIEPLETTNMCVLKIGKSDLYSEDTSKEIVAVININQFLSELSQNINNTYTVELDVNSEEITYPYVRVQNKNIVYSKFYKNENREEVVIYDYVNNVKKVRLNNNLENVSDLWHTYVINDVPYLISVNERHGKVINLNTHKTEFRFSNDFKIQYIFNDFLVITHHAYRIPFIRKECDYIQVFKFNEFHHDLLKVKAKYVDCLNNGTDLIIFAQ